VKTRALTVLLAGALASTTPRTTLAQDADSDAPPTTWTLPLAEGQSSVIYERFGRLDAVPVAVVEYRDGVWQRPSADAPAARSFVGALQAAPVARPAGRAAASMTLINGADGITVTFPEPSTSLVDTEGRPIDAYPAMEVTAAGWFTLPGESRPTAFVQGVENGAYCCSFTMLARREADGPWSWRARSWGPYRNLPVFDDLDRDGSVEWIARDERFRAHRWIYAEGGFGPLGVWHLDPTGFSLVTRRFPGVIEVDRRWLASVDGSNLALASWVAETRLLGLPVPTRDVRDHAVRIGAGEGTHETVDRWLRAIEVLGARYVDDHTARPHEGVRRATR